MNKNSIDTKFGNFPIRTKLFVGFFSLALITGLMGFGGMQFVNEVEERWNDLENETVPEMNALEQIETAGLRMLSSVHEYVLVEHIKMMNQEPVIIAEESYEKNEEYSEEEELEQIEEARNKLEDELKKYEIMLTEFSSDQDEIDDSQIIKEIAQKLIEASGHLLELKHSSDTEEIIEAKENLEKVEISFVNTINVALDHEWEEINKQSRELNEAINLSRLVLPTLSLIALVLAIILITIFTRLIANPILTLRNAALKIAKGNLKQKINIKRKDEIGDLSRSFNTMTTKLKDFYENLEKKVKEKTLEIRETNNRVEAEKARLETFLASMGEGVIAINNKGEIIIINKMAEQMFGRPAHSVINQHFDKSYHFENEHRDAIKTKTPPISDTVKKKKTHYSITYFVDKKGNRLPFGTTISPIIVKGKVTGVVGVFRDISKEKEIDRAKSDFISLASHQLRTPLTSIKWMLQEAKLAKNIKRWKEEYLKDAILSTERMIGLVHDLLNVSRLEESVIAVNPEKTDVASLIDDLIETEVQKVANEKNQKIEFKKPIRKVTAELDQQLLRQVISNLFSNALRYSPPGKTVKASLKKGKNTIEITIKDEGIGISEKDQKHLFEKFYRTPEASQYSTTGSGLGLYIIKKVLEACKGNIRMKSQKGKGSTFTINLPTKAPKIKAQGKELFEHIIS